MNNVDITEHIEELAEDVLAGKSEVFISLPSSEVTFGKGVAAGALGCGVACGVMKFGKWVIGKIRSKKAKMAEDFEEGVDED